MNYTISEVSNLIKLSKVSIYKKLKLKELKEHITKEKGITYIDEVGFNLIKYGINFKEELKDLKEEETNSTLNNEIAACTEELIINKEAFTLLKDQLKEQNFIIHELNDRLKQEQDLNKNNQILQLRQPQNIQALEEHFQDLDTKLMDIKNKMEAHREPEEHKELKEGFLKRLFG